MCVCVLLFCGLDGVYAVSMVARDDKGPVIKPSAIEFRKRGQLEGAVGGATARLTALLDF
jgi:hypothetical protein